MDQNPCCNEKLPFFSGLHRSRMEPQPNLTLFTWVKITNTKPPVTVILKLVQKDQASPTCTMLHTQFMFTSQGQFPGQHHTHTTRKNRTVSNSQGRHYERKNFLERNQGRKVDTFTRHHRSTKPKTGVSSHNFYFQSEEIAATPAAFLQPFITYQPLPSAGSPTPKQSSHTAFCSCQPKPC